MQPRAKTAPAPSIQAFRWFVAAYTGVSALALSGLAYLLIASLNRL